MYAARIARTLKELELLGLTQMIVSNPKAIWYLTGVMVSPSERLYALYLHRDGGHCLILNNLFHISSHHVEELWLSDTDDGIAAMANLIRQDEPLGVDKDWPARYVLPLMAKVPGLSCVVSSLAVDTVRGMKEPGELELMRQASRVNDLCMQRAAAFLHQGVSEREVAAYLQEQYTLEGCPKLSFPSIVAFGDHASDPHHATGQRTLNPGDCVLIDTGCVYQGYCSDMTRTFFYKHASQSHLDVHEIVRQANVRAIAAIKPGMRFCDIDKVARDYITQHGYGAQFTHRLGHSIGSDCHEYGDVSALNTNAVQVGNVFSIEPGIYLKGDMGVRIEDLVIVTPQGCEILNSTDKTALILGN